MLDLNHIELATEEDKAYQIDCWARLFKASTWKEMRELSENNPIFSEALQMVAVLSEEEKIRLQCEAREDYYRSVGWMEDHIAELTNENKQLSSENRHLSSEVNQLSSEIRRLNRILEKSGISDSQEN